MLLFWSWLRMWIKIFKKNTTLFCSHCCQENFAITWIKIKNEYISISVRTLQFVPCYKKESNIVNKCYCICSLGFSSCYCMKPASWSYVNVSMSSLLAHTVAQPTKWRFLPKNLNQLVIFVIGLAFTWSRVDKNRAQFQKTNYFKKWSYHKMVLLQVVLLI